MQSQLTILSSKRRIARVQCDRLGRTRAQRWDNDTGNVGTVFVLRTQPRCPTVRIASELSYCMVRLGTFDDYEASGRNPPGRTRLLTPTV